MKVRFQADADFNQTTAVFTATEYSLIWRMLDLLGFPGLALYLILGKSHDQRTMPRYFAEFITTQTSPGVIILLQNLSILEAINGVIKIWQTTEANDWVSRIAYVPF